MIKNTNFSKGGCLKGGAKTDSDGLLSILSAALTHSQCLSK